MNPLEIIEKQNEIIRIQSDAIDELFGVLIQHIEVAEADKLPVLEKISTAAKMRKALEKTIG